MIEEANDNTAHLQLSSATINRTNNSHLIDILKNQNISQQNIILNYRRELLDIRQFSATEKTVLEDQINELNQRLQELEKSSAHQVNDENDFVPSEVNKCSVGTNTEDATTSPIKEDPITGKSSDSVELALMQGYEKFLMESTEKNEVLSSGYKFINIMNP